MAIEVKELIDVLKKKEQNKLVEFLVVGTDGNLVCMDIEESASNMAELLKLFGGRDR